MNKTHTSFSAELSAQHEHVAKDLAHQVGILETPGQLKQSAADLFKGMPTSHVLMLQHRRDYSALTTHLCVAFRAPARHPNLLPTL